MQPWFITNNMSACFIAISRTMPMHLNVFGHSYTIKSYCHHVHKTSQKTVNCPTLFSVHYVIAQLLLLFSTFSLFPSLSPRRFRPAVRISSDLPNWSPWCWPSPDPPVPPHPVFHGLHARSASLTYQWPSITLPCHQLTLGPPLHHGAFQYQYGLRT